MRTSTTQLPNGQGRLPPHSLALANLGRRSQPSRASLQHTKHRIARVPFRWSGRTWGQSNLRVNEMGRRYLCTMLKICFERLLILDDLMDERTKEEEN